VCFENPGSDHPKKGGEWVEFVFSILIQGILKMYFFACFARYSRYAMLGYNHFSYTRTIYNDETDIHSLGCTSAQ
jgi:hypothetical protein